MLHRTKIIITILMQFCIGLSVFAQQKMDTIHRTFEPFGIKEGLSQGYVGGITRDKEGFMWFATKDGLNKYDGYRVTVYRHDPADKYSLPDNFVTQLLEDDHENLWVATSIRGLCLFDKKKERFYPVDVNSADSFTNGNLSVLRYAKGILFAIKEDNIYLFDVHNVKPGNYDHPRMQEVFNFHSLLRANGYTSTANIGVGSLTINPDSIWVFAKERIYLCRREQTKWVLNVYPHKKFGLDSGRLFYGIMQLPGKGKIVFSDDYHLSVYNIHTDKLEYTKDLTQLNIKCMNLVGDMTENVILNLGMGTFISFNPVTYELKTITSNIPFTYHLKYAGADGVYWIGSAGVGAYKYDSRKDLFHNHPTIKGQYYSTKSGMTIVQDRTGTKDFWLCKPNGNQVKKIDKLHPYTSYFSDRLLDLSRLGADLWLWADLPTPALLRYNAETDHLTAYSTELLGKGHYEFIRPLFTDHADRHWIIIKDRAWHPYVAVLNDKRRKTDTSYYFPVKNDMNEYPFVSDAWEDRKGVLWFGTLQGLFSFDESNKTWHQWKASPTDTSSLSSDMIFSLCSDPKQPEKYLWVGTNGTGLDRFEFATGKFTHFSIKNGLPNNVVYGILTDEQGNLWLSTNAGLTCFNPGKAPGAQGRFRNFTDEDGLPGNEFNRYEYSRMPGGEMMFGGTMGCTVFNPSEVLKHGTPPNIVLTGFSLFNRPFDYRSDTTIMNNMIGYADVIHLPYNKNMFTLEFAALDNTHASKKHYKYTLEGLNKEWIDNGTSNVATFTNIDPGEYTFRVTAAVSDGEWNDKGASIKIIISPPWWATWWFRTLLVAAVAAAAYAFYRYQLTHALKMQALRNNIASDLHDDIGSTLSSITMASTIMQKKIDSGPAELQPLLEQISRNTDNMMEAMSDIVWAINTRNDRFENVVSRVLGFATEILEPLDCTIDINTDNSLDSMVLNMGQRKNLYLILKEAINNAAKYAACNRVWVDIAMHADRRMVIKVRDNGKGFIVRQPGEEEWRMGGNGLQNMQKRAKELKGTLTIISSPGSGTEIILEIPV